MPDILHRIGVAAEQVRVFEALTTVGGIRNWRAPVEFMHHCSTKWATFLLGLRDYVEQGKGRPERRDTKIAVNA